MSSVVQDLEAALQAMQNTNPPGVSGTKINYITELSANNVQSESVIIQKLYTHFKKCPGTHKLGPLYVVDSIARRYLENARKNNQEVSASAPDGTYAAGVYRITNLLPMLMNDILRHAPPDENKDKIEKLYQIWERSATFPPEVLEDIKTKMMASPMFQEPKEPSTPEGTPPPSARQLYQQAVQADVPSAMPVPTPPASSTPSGVASMLQAIAAMAKHSNSTPTPAPVVANGSNNTSSVSSSIPAVNGGSLPAPMPVRSAPTVAPVSQNQSIPLGALPLSATSTPPNATSTPAPQAPISLYQPTQLQQPPVAPLYPNMSIPQPGQLSGQQAPQQPTGQPAVPTAEQLALLQLVIQQPLLANAPGVAPVLQGILAMMQNAGVQQPTPAPIPTTTPTTTPTQPQLPLGFPQFWPQQPFQPQNPYQQPPHPISIDNKSASNNPRTYSPPPRSPPRSSRPPYQRGRSRSRSPDRFDAHDSVPRSPPSFRRRSPVYGEYDGNNSSDISGAHRGGHGARGGKTARGGQRVSGDLSPPGGAGSPDGPFPKVQRTLEWDESLGAGNIRVLSRTLFVGGVNCSESDLRALFSKYGAVQSCIVNHDKRHAFVKMLTRDDAVRARNGMELYKTDNMTLRTRWGVGFGPRDCSDYNTGISVIPIDRLTEADQRWMVSAEYGGTGGTPLQGGMIVEEPDIEIGQGVSSKAISKRFPTDAGGQKGPHSDFPHSRNPHSHRGSRGGTRGGKKFQPQNQYQQPQQQMDPRASGGQQQGQSEASGGAPPPTPGFGAGFPFFMPGMGMGGFAGYGGAQQPPPGGQ
ncbi:hypothetical protein EX30DRAFT_177412 [Ascodesmis nigricans]|uniref:RNA binding protein Nrd1 n=1 Tax=Ascodesmis nigricans TaxID=341454 RepID=A0A4S2ML56_9PEZI|nr:hypothetical protein EX30DRAFT_177412 [Ascodesmis nigricans]